MKTFLAVVAIILSTVAVADAQVDNPEYKFWSGFKAGAWVKFKMVSESSGTKTEMEQTVKLVDLTLAKAVVETGMVMGRHVAQGPILVQYLVGVAIDSVMTVPSSRRSTGTRCNGLSAVNSALLCCNAPRSIFSTGTVMPFSDKKMRTRRGLGARPPS